MRPGLIIKMLFRSPVKTLVTFLLLIAISFGLLSRLFEYAVTAREYKRLEMSYQGTGTVEVSAPEKIKPDSPMFLTSNRYNPDNPNGTWEDTRYKGLPNEAMARIAALPYVTSSDIRYMTAGISRDYYRVDDRKTFYNYANVVILEGTLYSYETKSLSDIKDMTIEPYFTRFTSTKFTDIKILNDVGGMNPILIEPDTIVPFSFCTNYRGEYPEWLSPEVIKRSQEALGLINIAYSNSMRSDAGHTFANVSHEVVENFVKGGRYVLVATRGMDYRSIDIGESTASYWIENLVTPIPENSIDYMETEEFADLRLLIEMSNADAHTFDVVYTGDMSSITCFADNLSKITEGRALTPADNGSEVCVISSVVAKEYGLSVGDSFPLGLCDNLHEQHAGLGAVAASSRGRYSTPVKEITPEIVGIYTDLTNEIAQGNNPHWSYNSNTVFVPLSLLPVTDQQLSEHIIKPGEFSFIIDNIRDVAPFINEYGKMIEEMGLRLTVSDGGWNIIEKEFLFTERSSVLAIFVLILAAVLVVSLVVYLFIIRQKKEYAIMRATGCTKAKANMTVFLPLFIMGALAFAIGVIGAYFYTAQSLTKTSFANAVVSHTAILDASLPNSNVFDTSIPISVAMAGLFGILAFLCAAEWAGLAIVGRIPPLGLLQGIGHINKRKKLTLPDSGATIDVSGFKLDKVTSVPDVRDYGSFLHVTNYMFRNILRMKKKSFQTILVAAALFAALAQFAVVWQSARELFETFDVKVTFVDKLRPYTASQIEKSGLIKDPYVEFFGGAGEMDKHPALYRSVSGQSGIPIQLAVTNNPERYYGEQLNIEYAPEYSAEIWNKDRDDNSLICVMFGSEMDKLGVNLGDEIEITRYLPAPFTIAFRVAGRLQLTKGGQEPSILFLLPGEPHKQMYPKTSPNDIPVYYDLAEYQVVDNYGIDTLRKSIKNASINQDQYILDTESLDKVKENLNLIEMLFPIIAGVLITIGGLLPGLMVLQSAKEAALLRITGTSKTRTMFILICQHTVLCMAGLILGMLIILLYNGTAIIGSMINLLIVCAALFGICYIVGAAVCAWIVTRSKAIALLQVRE